MISQRPSVQLSVGRQAPDVLGVLASALAQWVDIRVPDGSSRSVGRLVAAPHRVEADDPLAGATAYVLANGFDAPDPRSVGALLVDWDHAGDTPHGAIRVPRRAGFASANLPISPTVRKRWRRRAGLPVELVLDRDLVARLEPSVLDSAYACAAAVWATGGAAERALALGAPLVTDHDTGLSLRLVAGIDALIVDPSDADDALSSIAEDDVLAARLSVAGRAAAERCDLTSVARSLVLSLGWNDIGPPAGRVTARLDELGTPLGAGVRQRAMALEYGLSHGRRSR